MTLNCPGLIAVAYFSVRIVAAICVFSSCMTEVWVSALFPRKTDASRERFIPGLLHAEKTEGTDFLGSWIVAQSGWVSKVRSVRFTNKIGKKQKCSFLSLLEFWHFNIIFEMLLMNAISLIYSLFPRKIFKALNSLKDTFLFRNGPITNYMPQAYFSICLRACLKCF